MYKKLFPGLAATFVASSALMAYVDPYGVQQPDMVPAQQAQAQSASPGPYGSGSQKTGPQNGPNPSGDYYNPQSPYDWPNYGNQQQPSNAGQPDMNYLQRGNPPNYTPNPTPGGYYQQRGQQELLTETNADTPSQ